MNEYAVGGLIGAGLVWLALVIYDWLRPPAAASDFTPARLDDVEEQIRAQLRAEMNEAIGGLNTALDDAEAAVREKLVPLIRTGPGGDFVNEHNSDSITELLGGGETDQGTRNALNEKWC